MLTELGQMNFPLTTEDKPSRRYFGGEVSFNFEGEDVCLSDVFSRSSRYFSTLYRTPNVTVRGRMGP